MRTHELSLGNGGARALIAIDYGCNLYCWRVLERELLYAPPGFGTDPDDLCHGGIPVLFPAVGRTWDRSRDPAVPGHYRIGGKQGVFSMPPHGFVGSGAWEEVDATATEVEARAAFAFRYDRAVRERHYPFDVRLVQEFMLTSSTLGLTAVLTNTGPCPAPFAFGYHPYFRVGADGATVSLPCSREVHLDPELLIPSGGVSPVSGDFRIGMEDECDCVYADLTSTTATIEDPANGLVFQLRLDAATDNLVVYSAAGAPFICVEPWTRGLGAYESLDRDDWSDGANLEVLAPGEQRRFGMTIEVRAA